MQVKYLPCIRVPLIKLTILQVHTRDLLVAVYRVGLLTVDGLRWED